MKKTAFMSPKFVSLYGMVVLLTTLFFYFLPVPEMLSWEELLLAKLLNQAPVLLCLGYLWFYKKRIREYKRFYLLNAFLILNVISEIHYYLVAPGVRITFDILNNTAAYAVLFVLYNNQRLSIVNSRINPKNLSYVLLVCVLLLTGSGFVLTTVYRSGSVDKPLFISIFISILTLNMSFFADKAFSRNWYKLVVGTVAIVTIDGYRYLSLFVFDSYPMYIHTIGKLIFSMGILLIVNVIMKKCLIRKNNLSYSVGRDF